VGKIKHSQNIMVFALVLPERATIIIGRYIDDTVA